MQASVILPTYNGEEKIGTTLEALCAQTIQNFETVVVIDGSIDATLEVIESFRNRLNKLVVINQPNGGRAYARNRGADVAGTETLIFIDDDIEVMPENIALHIDFQSKHKEATLVGNATLNLSRVSHDQFLSFRAGVEQASALRKQEGLRTVTFSNYAFTTCNMSISKKLFLDLGGFDERLTDSEDLDFSVRLLLQHKPIFFDTKLICYHNDFANLEQTIKRQTQYYQSKMKLLVLHPDYRELLPSQFEWLRKTKKDTVKKIIFSIRKLWEFFFRTPMFAMLPATVKHATFSSFIYTYSVLKVKP